MQNKRLELMMGIAEKELSGLASIFDELSSTLGDKLMEAIDLIEKKEGNVVLSGIGKSGMIANKIAATLTSTGTSSLFLHGTEASHGDLGLLKENDILFLISNSGETIELRNIVLFAKNNNIKIISITANRDSLISKKSDVPIILPNFVEACPHDLAPQWPGGRPLRWRRASVGERLWSGPVTAVDESDHGPLVLRGAVAD